MSPSLRRYTERYRTFCPNSRWLPIISLIPTSTAYLQQDGHTAVFSLSKKPFCHSEERSDVGIRNLLAANSHENARIVHFGNRLPRQSVPQGHLLRGADWLAMTGFFDRLKPPKGRFQRVDNPTPLSFRTSDRCHWCGNP